MSMNHQKLVLAGKLAAKTESTGIASMAPDNDQKQTEQPDSQTDLQLVRKVRNGDRAAFGA